METATKNTKDAMAAEEELQSSQKPAKAPPKYPTQGGAPPRGSAPAAGTNPGGYFHIYKKGQGYWTRMGTVAGVAIIGLLTANFLWEERLTFGLTDRGAYAMIGVFCLVYALLAFHYMNKPVSVDFLIATDSEMKKVNWTTRKELFGSTKVVIAFMFLMAIMLFIYDLFFQLLFWWLHVLKTAPFFVKQH